MPKITECNMCGHWVWRKTDDGKGFYCRFCWQIHGLYIEVSA